MMTISKEFQYYWYTVKNVTNIMFLKIQIILSNNFILLKLFQIKRLFSNTVDMLFTLIVNVD